MKHAVRQSYFVIKKSFASSHALHFPSLAVTLLGDQKSLTQCYRLDWYFAQDINVTNMIGKKKNMESTPKLSLK